MLRPMRLVEQWEHIRSGLPTDWSNGSLALRAGVHTARASTLLAPLTPGRAGDEIRFYVARRGDGPSPEMVGRSLARLDAEDIVGHLRLAETAAEPAQAAPGHASAAEAWDAALAELPPDWSDVYGEVELTSTDHLEPAALALGPVNPARYGGATGFRFRCARRFGYGASAGMVRRCLARLDEQGVPAEVRILRSLSDTQPVGTQGPVWHVGGKTV